MHITISHGFKKPNLARKQNKTRMQRNYIARIIMPWSKHEG